MPLFSRYKRPLALGKYPMEKIKRVDRPTTRIDDGPSGEGIPRIPKRADFFERARHGDLGTKPLREVARFISKFPLSGALGEVYRTQLAVHEGDLADELAPLPEEPQAVADHIKAMCYFLDADVVGICRIPTYAWYSHNAAGEPIQPRHNYAIVMLIDQGYETMAGSSGDDWISGAQSFRAYLKGSTIACTVASYLRKLGYEARPHTVGDSEVLHLPLVLWAGLGELCRIGEVVINPFLGPRFKTSVVTTNLSMSVDRPIDFGLQDFCRRCTKCARECPCSAISYGDKVMFNGYEMWKPHVEACARYRIMNPGGSACGRCMKVCPFNHQGLTHDRLALWLAMRVPIARKPLIWLDALLERGRRYPVWKWWFDLEVRDGKLGEAAKTNQRDLRPGRLPPPKQAIPLYPVDSVPTPSVPGAQPIDSRAKRKLRTEDRQA